MQVGGTEPPRSRAWLDRLPSWTFLLILAGLVGLAFVLSWAAPTLFWNPPQPGLEVLDDRCGTAAAESPDTGFFYHHYWMPILCDEGYNPVNTASWAILFLLLVLWAYRVSVEIRERVDLSLVLAVVPYLVWGSVYRVLEDADLFAPYGALQPPSPQGAGFLDQYLGVFFITPIIYVEVMFVVVGLLLWSHRAQRAADRLGPARGLQYFGYSLVLLLALYVAFWASRPTFIRFVANPLVALGSAAVAFWTVWRYVRRHQRFSAHLAVASYGLFFLLLGTYYVVVWMTGGHPLWRPAPADPAAYAFPLEAGSAVRNWPVQAWIFLAALVAPALVAYACRSHGYALGRRHAASADAPKTRETAGPLVTVFVLVLLVEAIATFLTILGMRELAQRGIAGAWTERLGGYGTALALLAAGPLAIAVGGPLLAAVRARLGVHASLLYYASPLNLLMVFGQMTDALMTSLGIDLYNYSEKHVLPGFLIARVDALGLPAPFGDYPTALVMIPLKLLIVLFVVLAVDASAETDLRGRQNLVGLVKLGIIMVGLSPGVRDAVRLAMAT